MDFVITLLVSPKYPTLDSALVESVRNAWGGGTVDWLAPDEAASFRVPNLPDNLQDVWSECQAMRVDLTAIPDTNLRKRLLIADMDSTMIEQECIDELADAAGFGDHVKAITLRAMNGEIAFEDALIERAKLLDGLDTSVITKVLEERISYAPGGATLVATMKSRGAFTALISGGFTDFTSEVSQHLGMELHRANELLRKGNHLTGEVRQPILGRDAKVAALQELTSERGLTEDDAVAVGDGANDLGMLQMAGLGVAMHAKPSVAAQSRVRINFGDLTALLYLQGYSKDEFVVASADDGRM